MSIHNADLPAWGEATELPTWNGSYVVRPKVAFKLIGCGITRGYELVNSGQLESYLDGRARKITVRSILRYIERRLAAANGPGKTLRQKLPPPESASTELPAHRHKAERPAAMTPPPRRRGRSRKRAVQQLDAPG
jgi:hypothetical protein